MKQFTLMLALSFSTFVFTTAALGALYSYSGAVTLCTSTCDSFASLDIGSNVVGQIDVNTVANGTFADADVNSIAFSILNPSLPVSGPFGDPLTDNPLTLASGLGIVASNGTTGTTDAINDIFSGQLLLEFLIPPFSSNGAFVVFDLVTGNGKVCLFFTTAGCIPGATEAVAFQGNFVSVGTTPIVPPSVSEPAIVGLLGIGLLAIRLLRK